MIETFHAALDAFLQPILIVMLLGTGVFLTLRLGFIQFRRFGHGIAVARGKYDDPDNPGDVSHFQALTTALSATVGIGNIAGVAIALHFGGPGAIFWMWVTAVLGMATKFTEVTLAQKYRKIETGGDALLGSVSGGPMYYIERGLGKQWKPLAMFVAFALMMVAFLNGNAIQANTIADLMNSNFGVPMWMTGLVTAGLVGVVILGGIERIGKVTGIIAPIMAGIYVFGGLAVLAIHSSEVWSSFMLIFTEAFNPTAGVAGTGVGVFIQTMLWGIRRGLFSNEAGQGSAPIAHSAAKTDEPVSEGVVALLEPFIDTIVICTITALVILTTGVWKQTTPTALILSSGDMTYVQQTPERFVPASVDATTQILVENGQVNSSDESPILLAWHDVAVTQLYTDEQLQQAFSGTIIPSQDVAKDKNGTTYNTLYGQAVETGAPLTQWAYTSALGDTGTYIVLLCVFLFAVSTAISWSYYGDRCVIYLFGTKAILPYKVLYVLWHFVGSVTALSTIWSWGDTALAFVTIPNVLALLLLSGVVAKMTHDYFEKLEER